MTVKELKEKIINKTNEGVIFKLNNKYDYDDDNRIKC
jgi:hypothetical protein